MQRYLQCNNLRLFLMRCSQSYDKVAVNVTSVVERKTRINKFSTTARLQQDASLRHKLPKENDEPVQFSGSGADRDAYETFKTETGPEPPFYERHIVKLTTVVFLIYFLAIREENDIDDYISANVFNVMDPYAEVKRLEQRLADEEAKGLDTTETQSRIVELSTLIQENKESGTLEATLKRIEAAKLSKDAKASK